MNNDKCRFAIGWPCTNFVCQENLFYRQIVDPKKAKETERSKEIGNCLLMNDRSWTLEEIGECWGLSRERIRQIEEKAMARVEKGTIVYAGIYDHIDLSHRLKKKLHIPRK